MGVSPALFARPPRSMPAQRTIGILSTYPPTVCGLATFSAALGRGLIAAGADVQIVKVADDDSAGGPLVVGTLRAGSRSSALAAAAILNECDAVIVQHEYGIYGGIDGDDVLTVLAHLSVPAVVVAHTVLLNPSPNQREVLVEAASLAAAVVVMSEAARDRLCTMFEVDPAKVVTIPHGALVPIGIPPAAMSQRPMLLTTGLIGPGKGIERVIAAMGTLHTLPSRPQYVVAGQTHPKVFAAQGDRYRNERLHQARLNGSSAAVTFDATYRDVPALTRLLQSATAIVLPYDSVDQVTSGVLVDAIASGRPVVATAFPHAVELLASGAGIVVDHDDADGLERVLHRVLTDRALVDRMAREARRIAPLMSWSVIGDRYANLVSTLLTERALRV